MIWRSLSIATFCYLRQLHVMHSLLSGCCFYSYDLMWSYAVMLSQKNIESNMQLSVENCNEREINSTKFIPTKNCACLQFRFKSCQNKSSEAFSQNIFSYASSEKRYFSRHNWLDEQDLSCWSISLVIAIFFIQW